jgi:hypothetical protein
MQLLVGPYALSGMNRTVSGLEVIGGSFDATGDHSRPPGGGSPCPKLAGSRSFPATTFVIMTLVAL